MHLKKHEITIFISKHQGLHNFRVLSQLQGPCWIRNWKVFVPYPNKYDMSTHSYIFLQYIMQILLNFYVEFLDPIWRGNPLYLYKVVLL